MLTASPKASFFGTFYREFKKKGPSLVPLGASVNAAINSWSVYSTLSFEGLCYSVGIGCPLAIGAVLLLPEGPLEVAFTVANLAMPYFVDPTLVLRTAIFTANMIIFKNVVKVAAPDL